MGKRGNLRIAAAATALLALTACSEEADNTAPEPTATETATGSEYDGLIDELAADQAEARAEMEASIKVTGGLALSPDVSAVMDDDWCLPLIPDQDTHERVFALTEEPQVQIHDAAGTVVGTAQIEAGLTAAGDACLYSFEATVPSGGDYYSATVASFTTDLVAEDEATDGEIVLDLLDDL